MLDISKRYIANVQYVISFTRNVNIRTRQFDIENALKSIIKVPSVNSNLPDDFNPSMARIMIEDPHIAIQVSQLNAQLTIKVDNNNSKPLDVIKNSILSKLELFETGIEAIVGPTTISEQGVVVSMHYPAGSDVAIEPSLQKFLYERFFNAEPFTKFHGAVIKNSMYQLGFKSEEDFVINYSGFVYQNFDIPPLAGQPGAAGWINVMDYPIREYGIEFRVDVNNRLRADKHQSGASEERLISSKALSIAIDDLDKVAGLK